MATFQPEKLHDQKEVAQALGKSTAWLERQRWAGTGPIYRKVGRSVRYLGADLNAWLDQQSRSNTGQGV